jgi:hypothetical protein
LVATDPSRTSDLETVALWCRSWLLSGENLYRPDALTDYPPNAIVTLSPLALLSPRWVVAGWTLVGLALAPVLPYVAVRVASPDRRLSPAVPPRDEQFAVHPELRLHAPLAVSPKLAAKVRVIRLTDKFEQHFTGLWFTTGSQQAGFIERLVSHLRVPLVRFRSLLFPYFIAV